MKDGAKALFYRLVDSIPELKGCIADIEKAFIILKHCYDEGGKVLVCGNGGSAADCEHIVGELMKGFLKKRCIPTEDINRLKTACAEDWAYLSRGLQGALPAISLVSQSALSFAFINDVAADMVFAQQVYGYGRKGDVLIGISTSGNSRNVVNATKIARAFGIKTVGLTGEDGGLMKGICDVTITVPAKETYKIQEYHLPVYHALCAAIEGEFFKE